MENVKTCNTCGDTKFVSEFPKGKGGKFGVRGDCKKCHSDKNKITCPKRKKHRREYMNSYYRNNKNKYKRTPEQQEKHNERRRELYKNDKDYREKRLRDAKEFRKRNPTYKKDNDLQYKYGITYECYLKMKESQNDKCKICKTTIKEVDKLYVDHCHDTGKVRGLLCSHCNFGIGQFRDNVDFLKNAIKYLKENG